MSICIYNTIVSILQCQYSMSFDMYSYNTRVDAVRYWLGRRMGGWVYKGSCEGCTCGGI